MCKSNACDWILFVWQKNEKNGSDFVDVCGLGNVGVGWKVKEKSVDYGPLSRYNDKYKFIKIKSYDGLHLE